MLKKTDSTSQNDIFWALTRWNLTSKIVPTSRTATKKTRLWADIPGIDLGKKVNYWTDCYCIACTDLAELVSSTTTTTTFQYSFVRSVRRSTSDLTKACAIFGPATSIFLQCIYIRLCCFFYLLSIPCINYVVSQTRYGSDVCSKTSSKLLSLNSEENKCFFGACFAEFGSL